MKRSLLQAAEPVADAAPLVDAAEADDLVALERLLADGKVRTVGDGGGVDVSLMRMRDMHDDGEGDDDGD